MHSIVGTGSEIGLVYRWMCAGRLAPSTSTLFTIESTLEPVFWSILITPDIQLNYLLVCSLFISGFCMLLSAQTWILRALINELVNISDLNGYSCLDSLGTSKSWRKVERCLENTSPINCRICNCWLFVWRGIFCEKPFRFVAFLNETEIDNLAVNFILFFLSFAAMKREAGDGPQGGGPQKRYRGGDGNEIRLLIPSKVSPYRSRMQIAHKIRMPLRFSRRKGCLRLSFW